MFFSFFRFVFDIKENLFVDTPIYKYLTRYQHERLEVDEDGMTKVAASFTKGTIVQEAPKNSHIRQVLLGKDFSTCLIFHIGLPNLVHN